MKKEQILQQYGEWTAHNLAVAGEGTMPQKEANGTDYRCRQMLQIVSDFANGMKNKRVLDLGSLEGAFTLEAAKAGAAYALGLEGREANIQKALFAKTQLGVSNADFKQADVRSWAANNTQHFDLVLCIGLLYHLDAPEVFTFLSDLTRTATPDFLYVDTRIAVTGDVAVSFGGQEYPGCYYQEHKETSTETERLADLWASLDNPRSYWFTRASLINFLQDLGYTSIMEVMAPRLYKNMQDRITLLAARGKPVAPELLLNRNVPLLRVE